MACGCKKKAASASTTGCTGPNCPKPTTTQTTKPETTTKIKK